MNGGAQGKLPPPLTDELLPQDFTIKQTITIEQLVFYLFVTPMSLIMFVFTTSPKRPTSLPKRNQSLLASPLTIILHSCQLHPLCLGFSWFIVFTGSTVLQARLFISWPSHSVHVKCKSDTLLHNFMVLAHAGSY